MTHDPQVRVGPTAVPWLSGGGEMGAVIRALDWAQTPIGPPASWSPSLRMMVRFLLSNRFPLLLWWGPHFCQLYNDPYRPVLGTKHPQSMGQPASACWSEIWHIIGPLIETPYHGGPATWMEDLALEINRYGFVEETHFTVAYSPVPDETVSSGIGGVLATVHEISDKVVGERRVTVLRDLGARASEAKTAEDACAIAAETLAQHPQDIPFALLYLLDADCQSARDRAQQEPGYGRYLAPGRRRSDGNHAGRGRSRCASQSCPPRTVGGPAPARCSRAHSLEYGPPARRCAGDRSQCSPAFRRVVRQLS